MNSFSGLLESTSRWCCQDIFASDVLNSFHLYSSSTQEASDDGNRLTDSDVSPPRPPSVPRILRIELAFTGAIQFIQLLPSTRPPCGLHAAEPVVQPANLDGPVVAILKPHTVGDYDSPTVDLVRAEELHAADSDIRAMHQSPSYVRPSMSRAYSRRVGSISDHDDRDVTVRRRRGVWCTTKIFIGPRTGQSALKEAREREHVAYMRTLTLDDIKRENTFRTAQRKSGKLRRVNIKDPNAPKKPDPDLVRGVRRRNETTKQSVLAKWRSMTDEERKARIICYCPFWAQAEQEKLEYEAARKLYEEGTTGYSSSINFSTMSGTINSIVLSASSCLLRPLKQEPQNSESEAEDDAASGIDSGYIRSQS
ncbi:hypothetical protein NM688_g8283 [Phlebia brevispora]|uniref:Uncharacterized protein n=1 Tax=Phlebia brevispora TaxID=194682 RepID=A0ACC1RUW4_9APHY|nr:hypothetical protein NM688_g8283 [Phlebia brevispora]